MRRYLDALGPRRPGLSNGCLPSHQRHADRLHLRGSSKPLEPRVLGGEHRRHQETPQESEEERSRQGLAPSGPLHLQQRLRGLQQVLPVRPTLQ